MKKFTFTTIMLSLLLGSIAYADNTAKLRLNIAGIQRQYPHFLCIYGVGCLNLLSYNLKKTFKIDAGNMANVKKIAITDLKTKRVYFQPLAESCDVVLKGDQTITMMGTLAAHASHPRIDNMHCVVS